MPDEPQTSGRARWPGLAPFSEEDQSQFFGRDLEVRELLRRVSNRRTTVLFGRSGLGKTSLIKAGLFPELRRLQFTPVYIRLGYHDTAPDLLSQVRGQIGEALGVELPADKSISAWAHGLVDGLVGTSLRGVTPVLVFDQFEELFTLGASSGVGSEAYDPFLQQFADLFEARPDDALVTRFEEGTEDVSAYDFENSSYRIILSVREDYLPQLERLRKEMPSVMENRIPLDRMRGDQALEAVLGPGAGVVDQEVAEAVVRFVGNEADRELESIEVEPSLLSLICRRLDEARGDDRITRELLVGRREEIIEDFYSSCFSSFGPEVRSGVEELLVTETGYRENVDSERLEDRIGPDALRSLVEKRLLQMESRNGRMRVELAHDLLCRVAVESRASRRAREARLEQESQARVTRRRKLRSAMLLLLGVVCPVIAILAWVAFSGWQEALGLKSQLADQNHSLRQSAGSLTSLLIGEGQRSTLSTATLVALVPEMERLQRSVYDASEKDPSATRALVAFHFQSSIAYGNSRKPEEALDQIGKARELLAGLPLEERCFFACDLAVQEAEVELQHGRSVDQLSPTEYEERRATLLRSLEELEAILDTEGGSRREAYWRWLKASSLLARMDRYRDFFQRSIERYEMNLMMCEQDFSDDINVLRMKAESLTGLGIISAEFYKAFSSEDASPAAASKRESMVGAAISMPSLLDQMVSSYRQVHEIRARVVEMARGSAASSTTRVDPWIRHDYAYALANLGNCHKERWLLLGGKDEDSEQALSLMRERKGVHEQLSRDDPGNEIFRGALGHGIANLVEAEFLLAEQESWAKEDLDRWIAELERAHELTPKSGRISGLLQRMREQAEEFSSPDDPRNELNAD